MTIGSLTLKECSKCEELPPSWSSSSDTGERVQSHFLHFFFFSWPVPKFVKTCIIVNTDMAMLDREHCPMHQMWDVHGWTPGLAWPGSSAGALHLNPCTYSLSQQPLWAIRTWHAAWGVIEAWNVHLRSQLWTGKVPRHVFTTGK